MEAFPVLREFAGATEAAADCSNCVMVPPQVPADHPRAFNPDTRCCTYYPDLPNFLIGRALAGEGAQAMAAELLACGSRLSAWGIEQPQDVPNPTGERYGRDLSARCPYWVGGQHACAIWAERNGVCRTWFCRYDQGRAGRQRWYRLMLLLEWIETALANICVEAGQPPTGDVSEATWHQWFAWCADFVSTVGVDQIRGVYDDIIEGRVNDVREAVAARPVDLPDVVVPDITRATGTADGLALEGYSSFDWVDIPTGGLRLFTAMDGVRTWREAARTSDIDTGVAEAMVRELYRIDILKALHQEPAPRVPVDQLPPVLEPSAALPIVHGGKVWIQGASRMGSVLAPLSVFGLLSRLDGDTPWRDALATARVDAPELDEQLVADLYQIGALAGSVD